MINESELIKILKDNGEMSFRNISKNIGISETYLYKLRKKYGLKVREMVFCEPILEKSKDLSYILGVLEGDGSVSKHYWKKDDKKYFYYQIRLSVRDEKFAKSFYYALKNIGLNPKLNFYGGFYRVNCCNKKFALWFIDMKLNDMRENINGYEIDFLRGFYESEGSYYYETGIKRPYVSLSGVDGNLMKFAYELIKELGFNVKFYEQKMRKSSFSNKKFDYLIRITKKDEPVKFIDMINPCIKFESTNKWF